MIINNLNYVADSSGEDNIKEANGSNVKKKRKKEIVNKTQTSGFNGSGGP